MAEKKEVKKTEEKKPEEKNTEKKIEKKTEKKTEKKVEKKTSTKKDAPKKDSKKADKEVKESVKAKTAEAEAVKKDAKVTEPLHPTLQKKKERREAKAARKEANMVEEKKSRPNNLLLGILIFGVLIGMFAFVGGYNYFQKSASIEKYIKDNKMDEMYGDFAYDEHTQVKMKAEGNTVKVVMRVAEDAPKETVESFEGEEGTKKIKDIGAYFLTTFKPETRGFGGTVKVAVKQGDKTINYVKMSYREAKKFVKELVKESQEQAEGDAGETDADSQETEAGDGDAAEPESEEHVHVEGEEHDHEQEE